VLLLLCLALSIALITFDFRQNPNGFLARIKDVAVAVVAPVQRGFSAVTQPVGDFFGSLGDLADIRSRNRELQDELKRMEATVEQGQALEEENRRLRAEVKRLEAERDILKKATAFFAAQTN
jgi:cell shape-determining protein MreC